MTNPQYMRLINDRYSKTIQIQGNIIRIKFDYNGIRHEYYYRDKLDLYKARNLNLMTVKMAIKDDNNTSLQFMVES